jgi:S-adenosylmethionine synthetase
LQIVQKNFDLRPGVIIRDLQLRRPIYEKTACYGHFGRNDPDFTWEKPKTVHTHPFLFPIYASSNTYLPD